MDTGGEQKKRHAFLAPLYVVKSEHLYAIWIVFVVFFGLINIWGGFLLGEITSVKEAFDSGVIYTFSISICAPFLAEVLVRQVVLRKMKKNQAFVFCRRAKRFSWIGANRFSRHRKIQPCIR